MDLVGICNDYAAATKQALKATEERVHADGKKLSAQRAALTNTAARLDGRRLRAINTEEEIDGRGIHGGDPWEQGREAGSNDREELTTMQRVKRVANVEGSVNPAGVGLEEGSDGVGKERQASRSEANLDRPRGAVGLEGMTGGVGRGGRLER